MKKVYRALSENEKRNYRALFRLVSKLWKKTERQESYNFSYIISKNTPIYCLYVFKYKVVDGKRKYNRPIKICRTYEGMSDYLNNLLES